VRISSQARQDGLTAAMLAMAAVAALASHGAYPRQKERDR
jgi:hypothetical protein